MWNKKQKKNLKSYILFNILKFTQFTKKLISLIYVALLINKINENDIWLLSTDISMWYNTDGKFLTSIWKKKINSLHIKNHRFIFKHIDVSLLTSITYSPLARFFLPLMICRTPLFCSCTRRRVLSVQKCCSSQTRRPFCEPSVSQHGVWSRVRPQPVDR